MFDAVDDQLVVIATVLGAVAALPTLIEFLVERRKRAERIALSLEDEPVEELRVELAGLEGFLAANADLIDAVRDPAAYRGATTGNEILILGPPMSGKKSLATWIAREARVDRLVTVHSPRDPDVLAAAKRLLARYRSRKVLLLLPNLDRVLESDDPRVLSELDALIDDATRMDNVLVVATAARFVRDGDLDDLFGVKLVLPTGPDVLRGVAELYLDEALREGCVLAGLTREELVAGVLGVAGNPAEVQDILMLCRTSALFGKRSGRTSEAVIDPDVLRRAIERVLVPT